MAVNGQVVCFILTPCHIESIYTQPTTCPIKCAYQLGPWTCWSSQHIPLVTSNGLWINRFTFYLIAFDIVSNSNAYKGISSVVKHRDQQTSAWNLPPSEQCKCKRTGEVSARNPSKIAFYFCSNISDIELWRYLSVLLVDFAEHLGNVGIP